MRICGTRRGGSDEREGRETGCREETVLAGEDPGGSAEWAVDPGVLPPGRSERGPVSLLATGTWREGEIGDGVALLFTNRSVRE